MRHGRNNKPINRRQALKRSFCGGIGVGLVANQFAVPLVIADNAAGVDYGTLQPADANGIKLPAGFTSRVVATTGLAVGNSDYVWHGSPDGGACFPTDGNGWVYVSNAELSGTSGGVGAIRFASDGSIVDAYPILSGTTYNCAGGPTPWNTWLSCEETSSGQVYECDPFTPDSQGVVKPQLGTFKHEAAAIDPVNQHVYLTEDQSNGLLYRFVCDNYPSLDTGVLQAAEILDPNGDGPIVIGQTRQLAWHQVPDPTYTGSVATRDQVPPATRFDGGEGCWYEAGLVHFSTKGDDRVWKIDIAKNEISIVYDAGTLTNPILTGIDNVFVSPTGDVFVAEDTGDMQIVALTTTGGVVPIVQVTGVSGSEICGPALSPDGSRLYFSSQRNPGQTFEVSGPWLGHAGMSTSQLPTLGMIGSGLLTSMIAAYGGLKARRRGTR